MYLRVLRIADSVWGVLRAEDIGRQWPANRSWWSQKSRFRSKAAGYDSDNWT